jgi:hypothetical protein
LSRCTPITLSRAALTGSEVDCDCDWAGAAGSFGDKGSTAVP